MTKLSRWQAVIVVCCVGILSQAQVAYRNLQPGRSTRTDVERVLGVMVNQISATLAEYGPPSAEVKKIYVQFRAETPTVERIEVLLVRPAARDLLVQQLHLKFPASSSRDSNGRLIEFFGPAECIALTYEGPSTAAGVSRVGFYSSKLFSASSGISTTTAPPSPPSLAPPPASAAAANNPPGTTPASTSTPPPKAPPSLLGPRSNPEAAAALANPVDFRVRLLTAIDTRKSKKGDAITGQVLHPPQFNGDIVEGTVRNSKGGGKVQGKSVLSFSFETLRHANQALRVQSDLKALVNSKGQPNVDEEGQIIRKNSNLAKIGAATAVGALIGGLAAGGRGAAIGAGVGAAASLILVEMQVQGANVSLAPGTEMLLSIKSADDRQSH